MICIESILKTNKYSVTSERLSIFKFLTTIHIFTYNDIEDNFKNIWRASIFRTLNLFLKLWIIRKIDVWDKVMTYELNDHDNHHEHMKCSSCNSIISFHSDNICKKIFNEAEKIWFKITSHNIWVLWTCKNCLN